MEYWSGSSRHWALPDRSSSVGGEQEFKLTARELVNQENGNAKIRTSNPECMRKGNLDTWPCKFRTKIAPETKFKKMAQARIISWLLNFNDGGEKISDLRRCIDKKTPGKHFRARIPLHNAKIHSPHVRPCENRFGNDFTVHASGSHLRAVRF